jgi:cardiolipin synthase (CMP-forming)
LVAATDPLDRRGRVNHETTRIATLPNALTIIRLLLVIPFAWLAMRGDDGAALAIFCLAGLTDAMDGHLARRLGQVSRWGRLADPVADKLLTSVAFTVLSFFRGELAALPVWLAIAVILRDLFILAGAALIYFSVRWSAFKPTFSGKLNTVLEIGVVICFLAATGFTDLQPFLNPLYFLLLISILVSGGDYLLQGVRMLRK